MCNCLSKDQCECSNWDTEAIIAQFPVIVKASIEGGKRIISFEASNQAVDSEGDCILQSALLRSSDYFINNGFLDIEHYCELGRNPQYSWLHIKDPDSWKVGKPLEVYDMGNYRTGIKGEILTHPAGEYDPLKNKYDWFWQQLKNEPQSWKASVFGYPGPDTVKGGCAPGTDGPVCATRYLVKSFRWHSTALTRNPINKSLKQPVQIVSIKAAPSVTQIISAKSFAKYLVSKFELPTFKDIPPIKPISINDIVYTRAELRKAYFQHLKVDCPQTRYGKDISASTILNHFVACEDLNYYKADIHALALSELIRRDDSV